jgi:hypothetical protein
MSDPFGSKPGPARNLVGGLPLLTILQRRRRLLDRSLRLAFVVVLVVFTILRPIPAGDAHAYWAVDIANPWSRPVATTDFTYSPPAPLLLGTRAAAVRGLRGRLDAAHQVRPPVADGPWALALVLPVVASDLYSATSVLIAAAVVGSFRRPGLWAIR